MLASFFLLTQDVEMSCPPWTGGQKGKDSLHSRDEGPRASQDSCSQHHVTSSFMVLSSCVGTHVCGFIHVGVAPKVTLNSDLRSCQPCF